METIKTYSFPRAGFLGNPSDGYYGKTISFAFSDFGVELTLEESDRIAFVPGVVDDATFDSPENLVHDVRLYGYYGGVRLLKAVCKRFFEYCMDNGVVLPRRNFRAQYKISIPRLVGLSGSSAICSAMLKALMKFYGADIPKEMRPTICLEAERELGINCGFQDRVIQIYNGLVYMDFERTFVEEHGFGQYEQLLPTLHHQLAKSFLPHLYIAYDANRAEESGKAHANVRARFEQKSIDVLGAMEDFAALAEEGRNLLASGKPDMERMTELVDENFNIRDRIFNVAPENRRMVMTARSAGASAKFAGSGGAIVGMFEDEAHFMRLSQTLATIGCTTIRPTVALDDEHLPESQTAKWRNA